MTTPWIAAFAVLAVTVVLLGAFILGLSHRLVEALRRLEELLGDPTVAPNTVGLAVGATAPTLARRPAGGNGNSADLPPTTDSLVIFAEPDCDPCRALVADLSNCRPHLAGLQPVLVSTPTATWADALADRWTLLSDHDRSLFTAWHVTGTPLAYVVGADGLIRAKAFPNSTADVTALCSRASGQHRGAAHLPTSTPSPSR